MRRGLILVCMIAWGAGLCEGNQTKSSARLGDLQVSATAAGPISSEFAGPFMTVARTGYYFVAVKLDVRNLAAYPACTEFTPILETKKGGQYSPASGVGLPWPQTFNLPPAKQSQGTYLFEVKEGQKPVALTLLRDSVAEDLCATAEGRAMSAPSHTKLSLDLDGLPNDKDARSPRADLASAN